MKEQTDKVEGTVTYKHLVDSQNVVVPKGPSHGELSNQRHGSATRCRVVSFRPFESFDCHKPAQKRVSGLVHSAVRA